MREADIRRQEIIEDIGTTDIIEDAGFLFPDGTLISMTKTPHGEWIEGHHLLIDYYDNLEDEPEDEYLDEDDSRSLYCQAVNNFLKEGNIRLVPESPGFAISSTCKLTKEQKMFLYDYVDYAKDEASEWTDRFYIDIHKPDGNIDYLVYDIDKLSVQKIMRDLEIKMNSKDIER